MRVATVVGARPQFIKAAPVTAALGAAGHAERLIHTGQHYDDGMSAIFFRELAIPEPALNLGIGGGRHGEQTARMLEALERALGEERPDVVLVYGDTNSTLAGALAACKLGIPLAHVEAGLRSFNRDMPEEHNRVLADHAADLLLCPTATAMENLRREGLEARARLVGDTMYDAVLAHAEVARTGTDVLRRLGLEPGGYFLATIHRPYNTDDPAVLTEILAGLGDAPAPVVFPVHPRTRQRMAARGLEAANGALRATEPVGYLDSLALQQSARAVLTDSGGVQKEAYFLGVPCLTLRPETEWTETLAGGWNRLVPRERAAIARAVRSAAPPDAPRSGFGDGRAAVAVVEALESLAGSA